jgi:hypothetical protein
MTRATRYASLPAWTARLLLALVVLLMSCGTLSPTWKSLATMPHDKQSGRPSGESDAELYGRILSRYDAGEPYYAIVSDELRRGNYPLRPPFNFRLPTLVYLLSALPDDSISLGVLRSLALIAGLSLFLALRPHCPGPACMAAGGILLMTGLLPAVVDGAVLFHEVWASLAIALSLALYRRDRWVLSAGIGLVAVLLRELALPYLVIMAALAWREGQRKELFGWLAIIALCAITLLVHLHIATRYALPTDPMSPTWIRVGGWSFVLVTAQWNQAIFPGWLVGFTMPLALLGLGGLNSQIGTRVAATVAAYVAAFMFFGRPDNTYWGLIYTPLLPVGLLFASRALADLWGAARLRAAPGSP